VTYSTPGGAQPPTRRRRLVLRRAAAVLSVLLLFGAIGYGMWAAFLAPPVTRTSDASSCVTAPPVALPLQSRQVLVNVYNATQRNGLAARTAEQLSGYGFRIGKIANDPARRKVPGAAEVRGGPKGLRQITVVRAYVGTSAVRRDKRASATVDLVLGTQFAGLRGPAARLAGAGCA
jgi:hypothetical protein